jgi:hypothetical protein
MMMANPAFWAVVACAASPAIILVAVAIQHYRRERLLRTCGTSSAGRIVDLGFCDDGLGGGSHWAKVEYARGDGRLYTSSVALQRGLRDNRVGQRVGLTYVPGRSIVRLDS